jgi:hypothetical protein
MPPAPAAPVARWTLHTAGQPVNTLAAWRPRGRGIAAGGSASWPIGEVEGLRARRCAGVPTFSRRWVVCETDRGVPAQQGNGSQGTGMHCDYDFSLIRLHGLATAKYDFRQTRASRAHPTVATWSSAGRWVIQATCSFARGHHRPRRIPNPPLPAGAGFRLAGDACPPAHRQRGE